MLKPSPPSTPPLRIVHIDDNSDDSDLLKQAMEQAECPFECRIFDSGEAALSYLLGECVDLPNLVILDLHLPGMDGHEILQEIRRQPRTSLIPVVIFSATESRVDVAKAYALRANSFIRKPSNLADLMEIAVATLQFWSRATEVPVFPAP